MWTPNMSTSVVKLLCHWGPIEAIAFDPEGFNMVTTGMDSRMKVWDIRMFKQVHEYFTTSPGVSVDVSQRGMIGVGFGGHVQVWKDAIREKAKSPYLNHLMPGSAVCSVRYRPYEDLLGVGHAGGVTTMVRAGSCSGCCRRGDVTERGVCGAAGTRRRRSEL
jgi:U3 small nucleolar RNA-associated protein 7